MINLAKKNTEVQVRLKYDALAHIIEGIYCDPEGDAMENKSTRIH